MEEKYMEDFLLWCRECVKITDKETGQRIAFEPNGPQRRLASELERQRRKGVPIRVILLKARQWGGSTLIQSYMAWMQLIRRTGWNSIVCAHVKDASSGIRGMYSGLLRDYPAKMKSGNPKDWLFSPYEKSAGVSRIAARDCLVAIASAQAPDALRGGNYFMAHLSEAAFWEDGDSDRASGVIRTVCGSIPRLPDTLIAIESTADGKGNFFHREWKRAEKGESAFVPVFVPWHEIEIYSRKVSDEEWSALLPSLTDYELGLVRDGISRDKIAWYHDKRKEYSTDAEMMAEFPGSPEESFATSGRQEFSPNELPELSHREENRAETLIVFTPGERGRESVITHFSMKGEKMRIEREESMNGSLAEVMERVITASRSKRLAIVESPDGEGISHARWCAAKAAACGIKLTSPAEDSVTVDTTPGNLTEMIDLHHDILARGALEETEVRALKDYPDFRRNRPWLYPRILNRLAAGSILLSYGNASPMTPEEFYGPL